MSSPEQDTHLNELEQTIELLEAELKQNPNDAEALGLLSLVYFNNNNHELAEEFSKRALEIDSTLYEAQLVDVMLRLRTHEVKVEEIQTLLETNPEDSRLWFALGSTYMGLGEFAAAKEYLEKTIKIHPEFYDCYLTLAWCQLLNNKPQEALETYQNAITTADDLADGWGGLAIIYALNTDLEQAEQLIKKADSINQECFLTEIAEIIYLTYKNPEESDQQLLSVLINPELGFGEKLAFIINELN